MFMPHGTLGLLPSFLHLAPFDDGSTGRTGREQILNLHSPISFLLSLSQLRDVLEELGLDVAVMENFRREKVRLGLAMTLSPV